MEYALRVKHENSEKLSEAQVLILILMEYALREYDKIRKTFIGDSLNPYSNGICSTRRG